MDIQAKKARERIQKVIRFSTLQIEYSGVAEPPNPMK